MSQSLSSLDGLADSYEKAVFEGKRFVSAHWSSFQATTRQALLAFGVYSDRGLLLKPDEYRRPVDSESQNRIEGLWYAVGILSLCEATPLPGRTNYLEPIPRTALENQVFLSCQTILFYREWHDATFLSLGLRALANHQVAIALENIGPEKKTSIAGLAITGLLKMSFLLSAPFAMAYALIAANKGDLPGTAISLYLVALAVGAWVSIKEMESGKDKPLNERTYSSWSMFRFHHCGGCVGAGARFQLEQMVKNGIFVPSVAFDLCAVMVAN